MSESKQAPTPGPDDTVRVSRELAKRAMRALSAGPHEDIAAEIHKAITRSHTSSPHAGASTIAEGTSEAETGRAALALSTSPASPDAGRVEHDYESDPRVDLLNNAVTDNFNILSELGFYSWHGDWAPLILKAFDAIMNAVKPLDAALAAPSAPEDAKGEGVNEQELAALRVLLDDADGSLDNDTYDQFHAADDADLPDDAEVTVRAGTVRKVNRVFSAIDNMLRAAASNTERG